MSAISIAATAKANSRTDQTVGGFRPIGRLIPSVMRKMRALRPRKTAEELRGITGKSLRAAERWLADARSMSAEDFIRLLLSEHGVPVIETLVAELPEQKRLIFWARVKKAVRRAELSASLKRQREELDQLEFPSGPADLRRSRRR